jgi:hypothetical protein
LSFSLWGLVMVRWVGCAAGPGKKKGGSASRTARGNLALAAFG